MNNRNIHRAALAALALAVSGAVSAQQVVFDPANAAINGANAAANAANLVANVANGLTNSITTGATLAGVIHQKEIENAIRNLEFASDDHFNNVENHQTNVENHQTNVENHHSSVENHNESVIKTWNTNNYYDGGIVLPPVDPTPIPFFMPVSGIEEHQSQFKSMEDYAGTGELVAASNQLNATAAVRETNATQLAFMQQQSEDMAGTIARLETLGAGMSDEKVLKSRNGQLQYANLIGLENTAQLVSLRQSMLVTENANNARAQLEADIQARQFANGAGISEAVELSGATTSW